MWYKRANIEPWRMTREEYLKHNYTGHIRSDAYESYSTIKGLDWLKYDRFKDLVEIVNINGQPVEIRYDTDENKYVKHDERDEILRDGQGMAIYLSPEEMQQRGYDSHSHTIAAFWNKQAVGFASDEFGTSGVWVVSEFQRKGLGTRLLEELHRLNPRLARNKIGQMTNSGYNMTGAYHKRLVQKALSEGKPVPPNVLNEYSDLVK